jgi:hypothetical protein
MISADQLQKLVDSTEGATDAMNLRMTQRIARRIMALFGATGKVGVIPASAADFRRIMEAGWDMDEFMREISSQVPGIQKQVRDAFTALAQAQAQQTVQTFTQIIADDIEVTPEAAEEMDRAQEALEKLEGWEKLGLPKEAQDMGLTPTELRLMDRAYRATAGQIDNLCHTTALAWQRKYYEACNNAYWEVTHGVSRQDAIRKAIDEAAKYGTHVIYPSGHVDKVEVAVARAVRTGLNQAAGDASLARCAQAGADYVLVSSHLGARVTDRVEPANHASWQGKVYHLDWNHPALAKYKPTEEEEKKNPAIVEWFGRVRDWFTRKFKKMPTYPDFIETTGYGTGEGLCGWNCRHTFTLFVPGVNKNNQPQYGKEENEKAYKLSQKQRAKERAIRRLRVRRATLEDAIKQATDPETKKALAGDLKQTENELGRAYKDYRDFITKHNLPNEPERMYVPGT